MPINPVQFAHQICDEFLRYIFSAFPLADPELAQQVKDQLTRPSSLDIPLVKGPYVSLSEAYCEGEPIETMAQDGRLHPVMPSLIEFDTMWKHQQEVFDAVKKDQHVLISTGTGSGKTEAFLYPIIDELLHERQQGITSGLKAIFVYPMNALSNDQLARLRVVLSGTEITFGQWIGSTPKKSSDTKHIDRFDGSSRSTYLAERTSRIVEAIKEERSARIFAPPEECCSEEEIRERQPRILLTNYRQLEILTTRIPDVHHFANAPLRYLVFDEAHTYEGAVGAEVSCLIRRVRALADKIADEVICIGTSATLVDPNPEAPDDDTAAKRFASRFFGVNQDKVRLITETYREPQWPSERYRPLPPQGDGMDRLARLLKALEAPEDVQAIQKIVEELTGGVFDPETNWQESLYRLILSNQYVYESAQILKNARFLSEGAWQVSQRVGHGRLPEGEQCTAELLTYLLLGAAAQRDKQPLLRPKVHFFLRGLDKMVAAFERENGDTKPILFLSTEQAKEEYPDRRSDAFYQVLTCKYCGQHFFEKRFSELELNKKNNRVTGLLKGHAAEDRNGDENAVWSPTNEDHGKRLVFTNRLLEDAEETESTRKRSRQRIQAWLCRQCGALHRGHSEHCLADGCGHEESLLSMDVIGDEMTSCPSCGSISRRIGNRLIEPAKPVRAVEVADVHILAQAMINAAPQGHKKLVVFADSRQDAAFQAGWMQDHARHIRLRHLMYEILKGKNEPLKIEEITYELRTRFKNDKSLIQSLFPELTGDSGMAFGPNLMKNVHTVLRYMVLREFTNSVRTRVCLESLGLAKIEYEGLNAEQSSVANWCNSAELSKEEGVEAISLILDMWRRDRCLYVEIDPIYSHYHKLDDEYIQAGLLQLREFHPKGFLLEKRDTDKYARGLISSRGQSGLQALIKKWSNDPDSTDPIPIIKELWNLLTNKLQLLTKVEIRSQRDRFLGAAWQIDSDKVIVRTSQGKNRCTSCQRIMTRNAPGNVCSRHHCKGTTMAEMPDKDNYDVAAMEKPFSMVSAEEHTAQVPGEVRENIERDFKSPKGRINCLVATPTLEMGVNIGALDMILMRNVPPRASNYWQRAGRAGRQERMAVITTYCRNRSHDRFFFEDPLRLLGGSIVVPAFNLKNPLMVAKHIRSALLSEMLQMSGLKGTQADHIREIIKVNFPLYIRDYFLDENSHYLDSPPSTVLFAAFIDKNLSDFCSRLKPLFTEYWPSDIEELTNHSAIEKVLHDTPAELNKVIKRLHNRLMWARDTRKKLHDEKDHRVLSKEEQQLLNRCDYFINSIIRREKNTYTPIFALV